MSNSLNLSDFLVDFSNERKGNDVFSVLNSVLQASSSNIINREQNVSKKIKVKHNALRDSVLTFRDLTLYFDENGIAETEAYNREIVEIEQVYRPGCFTFVDEVIETPSVDQKLEEARKELVEFESNTESQEIEEVIKEQTPRKGKKGKGK